MDESFLLKLWKLQINFNLQRHFEQKHKHHLFDLPQITDCLTPGKENTQTKIKHLTRLKSINEAKSQDKLVYIV